MKTVPSSTRKTLRADHSMMRFSISVPLPLCLRSARLHGRCRGLPGLTGRRSERAERRLEVALGIDQEIGADDDVVARLNSVEHLDVAVAACSQLDRARVGRTLGRVAAGQ